MLISVITIVKQEVAQLRSLIRGIDSQTRPVDELVIVALGRVGVQAEAELASSPVTILHDSPGGYRPGSLSNARDDGAEIAVGQLLVFLDADVVPCNQLVARYEEAALRHPEALLSGPVLGGEADHDRLLHPELTTASAQTVAESGAANLAARQEIWRTISHQETADGTRQRGSAGRERGSGLQVRTVPGAVAHRQRARRAYSPAPVTVGAGAMASAAQAVPRPWARR